MKDSDYLKRIGENIRAIRLHNKISQVDLAAACNFEKGNMRRIEAGRTNPTVMTLRKIASALDVPIIDFFAGLDENRD
jgi:transcriptional regulator with XRE-family HTH domain